MQRPSDAAVLVCHFYSKHDVSFHLKYNSELQADAATVEGREFLQRSVRKLPAKFTSPLRRFMFLFCNAFVNFFPAKMKNMCSI